MNFFNIFRSKSQPLEDTDFYKLVEKEQIVEIQEATIKVFFNDKKPITVKTIGNICLYTDIVDLKNPLEDEKPKKLVKRRFYNFNPPRIYFHEIYGSNNNQLYSIQDDYTKEIHHFYLNSLLKVSTKFKVIEKKTFVIDELVKI